MRPYCIDSIETIKNILGMMDPGSFKQFDTVKTTGFTLPLDVKCEGKVRIAFTPKAYLKMILLVDGFTTEIAWHGLVNRLGETDFEIYDILTYPQTVSAATVGTDQKKYNEWHEALTDDQFNNLRFQGHSHVWMAPDPSSTDLFNQKRLLDTLSPNAFYIFMIINKNKVWTARVYDLEKNVMYDEKDCSLVITEGVGDVVQQAKDQLTDVPIPSTYSTYGRKYSGASTVTANGTGKEIKNDTEPATAGADHSNAVYSNSLGWRDKNGKWHWNDESMDNDPKVVVPSRTTPTGTGFFKLGNEEAGDYDNPWNRLFQLD